MMEFMNSEADAFADSLDRLLASQDLVAARRLECAGEFPQALWDSLVGMGLPQVLVPEADGGLGVCLETGAAVVMRLGRHAVPGPMVDTMVVNQLTASLGLLQAKGPCVAALAQPFDGKGQLLLIDRPDAELTARPLLLRGELLDVPGPFPGQTLVVVGPDWLTQLQVDELAVVRVRNLAGEPRINVVFDDAPRARTRIVRLGAADLAFRLWARMALLRAAQMVGAMEGALALTCRYAADRNQFGKAIGSFQVIQHHLASMAAQVAACRTGVLAAAKREGRPDEFMYAAVAKARVSEAAASVAAIAHQLHGAMGFTHEYGLQPLTVRLWAWRDDFGHETWWQRWLGQMALEAGGAGTWAMIAADSSGSRKE